MEENKSAVLDLQVICSVPVSSITQRESTKREAETKSCSLKKNWRKYFHKHSQPESNAKKISITKYWGTYHVFPQFAWH